MAKDDLTEQDRAAIAELDEALARFESQKRWSDYIRTLVKKSELVVDVTEKVDLLTQAGALYIERSANQAEAIKCYEKVLELDRHHREAIGRLKEMYEKRRDWERLIHVMQCEAELLDDDERMLRYHELAKLATERLRKPQVCVDLWQLVLKDDPENPEALEALSGLYERSREWVPLAAVLEKLLAGVTNVNDLKAGLQKLGMIYAEKIGDDEGAVRTFSRLLELDPEDRRAQEQLKRRYVSLKSWDQLEAFYQASEKWDELIRTFEQQAELPDASKETQIDLLFRIARLWAEKKEKTDRAAKAYEKILSLDATNLEAAEALSPIYEHSGDAANLARVYEVRLGHMEDPMDRVTLLRENGLLYEGKLNKAELAFERFLEAFKLDPSQELLREDVQRVAAKVSGWDRLADAYETAIKQAANEDDQLTLRVYFGEVLRNLGRTDEAIKQFRAVYDAQPDHSQAIAALGDLYRETKNHRELLDIYERRLELESDPDVRRQLAYGRASLFEEELGDAAKAIDAYTAILDEHGDEEAEAFRALDRLYQSEKKHRELVTILERRIALGPESHEELASLQYRLGRELEQHLDDKERAVEIYREVLTAMPEHEGAREALEGLMDDDAVGLTAAEILEPVYEERGDWESLVRALSVLAAGQDNPERKHELSAKIAEIFGTRIGDQRKAFDALVAAFEASPDQADTLGRLEVLAVEQDRFEELVSRISTLAGKVEDPALARALWLRVAEYQSTQLSNVDGAVAAYEKILAQDPSDMEVLDRLENLHRRGERWAALADVLRKKSQQVGDPEQQQSLLAQMAHIHDEMLGKPDESIIIFSEILDLDPTNARALAALDKLYERQGMWTELADNLDRQLAQAETPEEQVAIRLRSAKIREEHMNSTEAAIEIYRDVLDLDGGNAEALAALERLLQVPAHQMQVAEILEPIYLETNAYEKLIGVHEIQVKHEGASSPERKVELLHRIAELYEMALDNVTQAFATYARAFADDPANADTTGHLERLASVTTDYESLAKVYGERVETLEDPSLAASLHMKIAAIRQHQLGDQQGAIAHYNKVLEVEKDNLEAATSLEQLYQLTERYQDLASIYLRKADMLSDVEERKAYLFRGAAAYEELLNSSDDAILAYEAILEIDPEDLGALDKLLEIHRREKKWAELLEVYNRKVDVVADPDAKKSLFLEIGGVYEQELSDSAKAIDTYQRILEIDPDDTSALGRLDALYQATEKWQDLLSVLERESELSPTPDEAVAFRFRVAELWRTKLEDALRAVDIYREILEVVPDHAETLAALEGMMDSSSEPVAAATVLDGVYRQAGEFRRLARVLEVQIAHEEDPVQKVDYLHQLAELEEVQLGEARAAFDAYARALPHDSANEVTIGSLERIAELHNWWPELAQKLDEEIEKLGESPDALADLAMRTAQVYELQLGNVPTAIDRYRKVLEADPGRVAAIEALDRLYEASERWDDLAAILEREVEVAASPEAILNLQFRLGQVQQTKLGWIDKAVEQYREILGAAPEYTPALSSLELLFAEGTKTKEIGEILEPHYRMQEQWDKLLNVHERQLEFVTDRDERVSLMHRMAEVAEERAGDPTSGFVWMQRALREDPSHDHTLAEVERLAAGLDGWADLTNTYADVLAADAHSAEHRVSIGKRSARVFIEEQGDVHSAEATYRYLLGIQPKESEVLAALDEIYEQHGSHEALATTLRRRIEATDEAHDKVELSYRLGQVLEHELGRTDEAIAVYDSVLSGLEPEHADSIHALASIYAGREDWPKLFKTFEKELDVVHGDHAQAEVLARMAYIAFHTLHDAEKSIELWRKVLDLRGEDAEALSALGDVYASLERYTDLVDVLERESAVVEDEATRIAIFSDMARIWYEKLGRERNALDAWERVLDIDPARVDALYNIAQIHRNANHHQEYADSLSRIIDTSAAAMDAGELSRVYMQLGYVFGHDMEQPLDAIEAYSKAVEADPHNHEALDALEFTYRKEGNWEGAVETMEQRASVLTEPAAIKAQLLSIARTWANEAGDANRGTSAYQRILDMDPSDDYAFHHLEALHSQAARWDELVELYLARLESLEDPADRIALLQKVARVHEEKMDDGPGAYEALKFAWATDFTNKQVASELERVTRETNSWNDLLTNANNWLQETQDPQIKIAICLNCARWYGTGVGRRDYAIPYFEQINQLDPNNVESKQQLAELYHAKQQYDQERQVLEGLVTLTSDPEVKADTYVKIGNLCRNELGIADQAQAYYQSALSEAPNHVPALEALAQIHRENRQWTDLLSVLKRKVKSEREPEAIAEAKLEVAEVYEHELGSADEAIQMYREVRDVNAQNLNALRGLDRLYTAGERWHELTEILEAEYDVVTTERDRINILGRLAQMWEEEFVKPDKAVERLEQILEIDPHQTGALEALSRLYRQLQNWEQLMATYERHVEATPDRHTKGALYRAMAELYAHELSNQDRAVDCYLAALDIDEDDVDALDGLTHIYEKRGDHAQALETMEKVVRLATDKARQVDLRYRMGRILDEQLGDRAAAVENFDRAIDLDPTHLPSLEAMRRIHLDAGDWLAASRVLEQEANNQPNGRLAAKTLVELGRLYADKLEEPDNAVHTFELARERDPDNEDAAMPLAIEYTSTERWTDAHPILEMLFRRADKRDTEEQKRIAMMYGQAAAQVGERAEAIKAFNKAYLADPQDLQALVSLANAYFAAREWADAFKYFQMLLVHQRENMNKEETTDVFHKLGVIKREQGEVRKALNMFDKALEEDAFHRPTLEAVVAIHESQNEWEKVIHYKRQLVEVANDDDERFKLFEEIGDLWKDKVQNEQKAIQAYTDATDVKPDEHKILHKLLMAYQGTKQWDRAVDIIQTISDLDTRPIAKSKYAYTAGVIIRDEMKDVDRAVAKFEEALDLDWEQLKAFEAVNKIHTQRKDWKQLERAYRKMLHRAVGKGNIELEYQLWHSLGVIYRDRQQNYESAAEAFKMATKLKPKDTTEHQILAELYAMIPNRLQDAIDEHQLLLREDPQRVDSYRALYRLYFDAQMYDKAWCLAAALSFLGKADPEQKKFYDQYKPAGVQMNARLDNQRWVKDVFHPDESLFVGKMFEPLSFGVLGAKASSDKAVHLLKKYEVDPANHTAMFAKMYDFVAKVLNLQFVPRLFLRPDQQGPFIHVPGSNPPAVVCLSSFLSGYTPVQLGFVIGRHLAYYRGEHFIRTLITSHTELKTILLAGLQISGVVPPNPQVTPTAQALQAKLGPTQVDALRSIAKTFVEAEPNADVKKWMQSVELTACRAGFLFCNDLLVAAQMIQSLPAESAVDLPAKEKIKEMVLFSVSEQYFRLREYLGLRIRI